MIYNLSYSKIAKPLYKSKNLYTINNNQFWIICINAGLLHHVGTCYSNFFWNRLC